jgi:serine protease Do
MSFWKNVVARPGLWIACGLVIGVGSTAAVVSGLGSSTAIAQHGLPVLQPIASIAEPARTQLRDLDEAFADLVEFISPSVVHIRSGPPAAALRESQNRPRTEAFVMASQGSGVIYRQDGWIITSDHVVQGFERVTVTLADGRELEGTVRHSQDLFNDIAVVKVEATGLTPARFGDSGAVRPGQHAIAVGAPFGLENSVTIGHISGLGRANAVASPEGQRAYTDMIQTDAPINPGNSGGPLMNIDGEVIGINTSIVGTGTIFGTAGNVGIGFAIPSNQARLIADMLIERGRITRAFLGITMEDIKPYQRRELRREYGVIVREAREGGPAAAAGLRPDDIIVRVGETSIRDSQDIRNAMLRYAPNTNVDVVYVRNGATRTASVRLAPLPPEMAAMVSPRARTERAPGLDDRLRQFPFLDGERWLEPEEFRRFQERFPGLGRPFEQLEPFFGPDRDDSKGDVPPVREGHARLGVTVEELSPERRSEFHVPANERGVLITVVEPGSVAERLGLKPGDVISRVGDRAIERPQDLVDAMRGVRWGDTRRLSIARFGEASTLRRTQDVRFR